jgi:hypothetical protein
MYGHGACPDFLGADASVVDRRCAVHPWRLGSIAVQRIVPDHPYTFGAPVPGLIFFVHVVFLRLFFGSSALRKPSAYVIRCDMVGSAGRFKVAAETAPPCLL